MWMMIVKGLIAGAIVVSVSEVAGKYPKVGGLILTLPLTSIMAFLVLWRKEGDIQPISVLAGQTLVLVPLGLAFFVPLAFAKQWNLGFWEAFGMGVGLALVIIAIWFRWGPTWGMGSSG